MRVANLAGRMVILGPSTAVDVAVASGGRYGPEPRAVWNNWAAFFAWASELDLSSAPGQVSYDEANLDAPSPSPSQVFAIGLNYADHATESRMEIPVNPVVFTKYPSSLAGASTRVALSSDRVDWEAELVVVIGIRGRDIPEAHAWDHVAGLTVGQDLSDRTVQNWGPPAQFSLGKSFAGFSPTGPAVVTPDEISNGHNINALSITCIREDADGIALVVQDGNTRDLIFPIPALVARLSRIVELRPGDLIFTGTPSGVGIGRQPQEFLRAGTRLTTTIEGIGTIAQQFHD